MKKMVSLMAAAALLASVSGAVIAEDNVPSVYVDSNEIIFEDQTAVILDERTLVPARGVFEAMGAKVDWDGETRMVEVESGDHKTIVRLTIDDNVMKVYDMTGMMSALFMGTGFSAPLTEVELDVAPQILNDRTMIPLRAISEAMGAKVDWNDKEYRVDITTADTAEVNDDAPAYSLSADKTTVEAGETVDIYINAENLPSDRFVAGVTAVVKYDNDNFEFVEASLVNGDNAVEGDFGVDNAEYRPGYVKVTHVTIDDKSAVKADGKVLKLTFKSINGEKGEFALVNSYDTGIGYNITLQLDSEDGEISDMYSGDKLKVSADVVAVNDPEATEEPAVTADPAATVDPEATAEPAATVDPEATVAPEATADPAATVDPEATAAPEATADPAATAAPEATAEPAK